MKNQRLSADEWDEQNFPRPESCDFDAVVQRSISRRGFLGCALTFGSAAAVMGTAGALTPLRQALASTVSESAARFPFTPIEAATDNTIHLPEGYRWQTLVSWGDALDSSASDYSLDGGGALAQSDRVFGENNDGMEVFLDGQRQLLAINNEYANLDINLPASQAGKPASADDVSKLQNLQGVTVLEVTTDDQGWQLVKDSPYIRRITHTTPMQIVGPAAGYPLLQTAADPEGNSPLGTLNNCGSGKTPWGTYLSCEENFNGYFGATDGLPGGDGDDPLADLRSQGYQRYGVAAEGAGYDYHLWDARFDVSQNPNELHRFGWVVEIDPRKPDSTPVKHTGLGRFKHENAEVVLANDGRVVVYMGDDERGEYLYRFVSDGTYTPGGSTEGLLDEGTLYAARFDDDQSGQWLPLTPESTGMSAEEILIFTRMAASAVNATTMDRPEWVSANPHAAEVYCCLTNNKNRGIEPNAGGDDTSVNPVNPREANHYGQIVRWRPQNNDHVSDRFEWDLYVMAGNPTVHDGQYAGSENVHQGNLFNSPDGMAFDSNGLLWIQTDGDDSNEGDFAGMGNNQMLVGDPVTGEIARFLTGPSGCEVTGLTWSSDRRAMFVGIQHPGGNWPDGDGLPRSSVIVVSREDGRLIG